MTPERERGHQIKVSTEGRATKRTAGRPADRACQPPIGFRNAQRFGSWNQAQHPDLMAHPAAVLATATWPKGQKSGLPRCCKRCFVRRGVPSTIWRYLKKDISPLRAKADAAEVRPRLRAVQRSSPPPPAHAGTTRPPTGWFFTWSANACTSCLRIQRQGS